MQDLAQTRQLGAQLLDQLGMRIGLGDHQHRAGVLQHPAHLLSRGRVVNRDGDRADREDRVVEDHPLVAGGRQDRHPVTRVHSLGDQTERGRTDLLGGLGAGHVRPHPVDQALENHMIWVVALV